MKRSFNWYEAKSKSTNCCKLKHWARGLNICFMIIILTGMIEEGFGHIVNISSIAGKSGGPRFTAYSSAKFAIFGLMDSVRYEVENL